MSLCDLKGRFLHEVAPHIIPQGRVTYIEQALWAKHYADKQREIQRQSRQKG